jgi:DNA-binding XRE family transcriptional regulator
MIAAIRAGVPLGDVQGLAGHMSPETTRRFYAPFQIERQRAVSDQLAGRFAGVFGPQPVVRQEAGPGAPGGATVRDRPAERPVAAPLALVPPGRGRRGWQAARTTSDVKDLRKRLGLTQKALGARLGVSAQTIKLWEGGRHEPRRRHLTALRALLPSVLPSEKGAQ